MPDIAVPLVLACGALVRELRAVLSASGLTDAVEVDFLPAPLHNRPGEIVPAIEARLADVDPARPIVLGYADCGTGGQLDAYIDRSERRVARLPGDHCYEFFAGGERFAALHAEELGTFFLTDFLARHFDALIWRAYGFDEHPELRELMFGNYTRVVLLSQTDDGDIVEMARDAAARLGLAFHHEPTGLAPFAAPVELAIRQAVG